MTSTTTPRIEDVLALSPLQEGLYALAQVAGDGDLYGMQFVIAVDGPADPARLRRSTETILRRHPNLRAVFWDQDLPHPVAVVPAEVELPWTEIDATAAEVADIAGAQLRCPFDLRRGPLLRVTLIRLPDRTFRMIVTAHHILMDGWSIGVFFRELFAVYAADGDHDLPAPRPYRDYIGLLAAHDAAASVRAWSNYLAGVEPLVVAERADEAVNTVAPHVDTFTLDELPTARLRDWARAHGLTLNTVVQFAWAVLLGRLTDRRDVVFGTTVTGRPDELTGVETMIGLFINTIPVRIDLDANGSGSVAQQCAALQRESAGMRDHSRLSLATIARTAGTATLFDTLFVFENAPVSDLFGTTTTTDGVGFRPVASESLAHYPLSVAAYLLDGRLTVTVEAVAGMLGRIVPSDIGIRLLGLLEQLPGPGDRGADALDVLLPGERPTAPAPPAADVRGVTVAELFARQAAATPDAPALTTATERYTYRELASAAAYFAQTLRAHGVGPEDRVALAIPRGAPAVVAILGVLAAGAAYVPIDVTLPPTRIESILRQAQPRLIVTDDAPDRLNGIDCAAQRLEQPTPVTDSPPGLSAAMMTATHPDQAAYVIFTSGSTGEPKGVVGTHAALAAYFADHRDRVYRPTAARLGRPLRIAHVWSLSFDASWQPMIGLLDGHAIHLFDADDTRDAERIVAGIAAHGIDMLDVTPSMLGRLADAGLITDGRTPLSVLAMGGEAVSPTLWRQLCALPGTYVQNCYGPTETTVEAVVAEIADPDAEPAIGAPTVGTAAYVLDSRLRPVPDGVVGELYLSGAQLTRGYLGRPALTAERFVADPVRPGQRAYRTGDLVRRLPSGSLAYLGRRDDQLKIRGYRVELGEIDTALRDLPGVAAAAVVVVRRGGAPALAGFVTAAAGAAPDPAALRARLADRLPAYMVPARVVVLDRMPVTAHGKLDTKRLQQLGAQAMSGNGGAAPVTPTQRAVCAAIAELSGGPAPGIDDDPAALGIDSIVAIALVNRLRRDGLTATPRLVLSATTIADLAARIDAATATQAHEHDGFGAVGPVPIQSWMTEYGRYQRYSLSTLLELPADIDRPRLETLLQWLLDRHDMLRCMMTANDSGYELHTREPGTVRAADLLTVAEAESARSAAVATKSDSAEIDRPGSSPTGDFGRAPELTTGSRAVAADSDFTSADAQRIAPSGSIIGVSGRTIAQSGLPDTGSGTTGIVARAVATDREPSTLADQARTAANEIDILAGEIVRAVWLRRPDEPDLLLLTIHHAAVDPVSWHIVRDDLADGWARLTAGRELPSGPPPTTSYRQWARQLRERGAEARAQLGYWAHRVTGPDPVVGSRRPDPGTDRMADLRVRVVRKRFAEAESGSAAPVLRDRLLAALTVTLATWHRERGTDPRAGALLTVEGHGRADDVLGVDTTATVGWFNSLYPTRLGAGTHCVDLAAAQADPHRVAALIAAITAELAGVPNDGIDYGVLRYLDPSPDLVAAPTPQVLFDHLGRYDLAAPRSPWSPVTDPALLEQLPLAPEPDFPLHHALEVITGVQAGPTGSELVTLLRWNSAVLTGADVERIATLWSQALACCGCVTNESENCRVG
ncbi:non-ribosomal peptide synthetase [Nocardia stercoris]|uniref:Amino acid adenylation domain-containing protein n=1 Tax=Nocardia stercoris TaxID=2483361 RepID=A0A3M2KTE7_9NOCA|nr:non-ribosomal peptide synthetase [Nocardia stercoris]RMI28371.1 amino acid adenylation domain-containing protein [Nocardia stercoris]